jgi:hypothetical protein
MYIVTVRLVSPTEPSPDAPKRLQAAYSHVAEPGDGFVHAYQQITDGELVAAVFVAAPTVEAAESCAARLSARAALHAGLDAQIADCGVTLVMPIVESTMRINEC